MPDPDRLRWVLNFTSTVWPGVMFATNAGILAGLDLFHRTYEAEYNLHELKNKLGKISPSLVHQEAMDIAHASKKRRRVAMCYSMAIQRLYDKNRKRKHRLEPDSDRYLD